MADTHDGSESPVNQQHLNPPTMTNGNALTSLNVEAKEFRPPQRLMEVLHDRAKTTAELRRKLRNCLLSICADEVQYEARVDQLVNSLGSQTSEKVVLAGLLDELVSVTEEDASRGTMAARLVISMVMKSAAAVGPYLQDTLIARAVYWSTPSSSGVREQNPNQPLAFATFMGALYATITPRMVKLGSAFAALLDSLATCGRTTKSGDSGAGVLLEGALDLAELYMAPLIEDWVQAGENLDASVEKLVTTLRHLLVQGEAGSMRGSAAALGALETRASEIARFQLYAQLDLSRQASDIDEDVYDEFEKFLHETGQS